MTIKPHFIYVICTGYKNKKAKKQKYMQDTNSFASGGIQIEYWKQKTAKRLNYALMMCLAPLSGSRVREGQVKKG